MDAAPVITTPAATKPARLEDQIRSACRVRHYSLATEVGPNRHLCQEHKGQAAAPVQAGLW